MAARPKALMPSALAALLRAAPSPAQPPPPESGPPPKPLVTAPVVVAGRAPHRLEKVPGSQALIGNEELRQLAPQSGQDALRTLSGVNVLGEDGIGLRLNVGIRGLDPNRSRKVLVLEDGMPVAPNPYGAPESYYTPAIERMERIEVIKGSGQILSGPQTLGGSINYITRDPPKRFGAGADLRYGSFGYLLAQAGVGATHGPVGWRLDAIHRRWGGPRRLDLALTDLTGKLRLRLTSSSVLTLKLGFYDESSRATYIGPTTPQFQADPTINLAENDRFLVRRHALGLIHQHLFSPRLLLVTTAYAYQLGRAWRRQHYDREDRGLAYERICDGAGRCGLRGDPGIEPDAPGLPGGSVFFRQGAQLRDRAYLVAGLEPRLTFTWSVGSVLSGELTALLRFHHERARERIIEAAFPTGESGITGDDERRTGYALAAAVQHRFGLFERLFITPGLRVESYFSRRDVLRERVAFPDGSFGGWDRSTSAQRSTYALIPGLGVSYQPVEPLTLFGGVHRGYAPPRSKDVVGADGQNIQLEAESSWNFELGARVQLGSWLSGEAAGFHLEVENQVIPEPGGAFSSGPSRHSGVELSGTFDLAGPLGWSRLALPLTASYTYLPLAEFVSGPFAGFRLPYAPEHLLYAQLRFAHAVGVSAQIGLSFVAAQFSDKGNTLVPSPDGLVGEIPGYLLLDARVAYTCARIGLTAYLAGKNLTDKVYIASRSPEGIQPAGFRQIFGGLEWSWDTR